jgi:putative ABC transport system permease protein
MNVQIRVIKPDGTVDKGPTTADRGGFFFTLHVVDDSYLATTTYALQPRAAGYSSDRAAWDAVRANTGYAIIDASNLSPQGTNQPLISNIKPTDAAFQPFKVQLATPPRGRGTTETTRTVTVVGFMTRPAWSGTYVSTRTAMASGLFAAPAVDASLLPPLAPTGYYFALKPGVDVKKARLDIGRMLVPYQLEPVVVADQVAQQLSSILALLNLITGFLALGLIVGIAGLGVITTRAVVERWQQIGMLRALGYRRSLVQVSFLMESSFIAILGLAIGSLLGVWQSYRFFVTDKSFGNVDFHVPFVEIGLILVGAYLATLLTTFLPARAAARIAPAEALRYE